MTLIVTAILTALLFINRAYTYIYYYFLNCFFFLPPREEDNDVNVSSYPKILINVGVNKLLSEIFFTLTASGSPLDLLALSIRNRIKHFC